MKQERCPFIASTLKSRSLEQYSACYPISICFIIKKNDGGGGGGGEVGGIDQTHNFLHKKKSEPYKKKFMDSLH